MFLVSRVIHVLIEKGFKRGETAPLARKLTYVVLFGLCCTLLSYSYFAESKICASEISKLYYRFASLTHNDKIWHYCTTVMQDMRQKRFYPIKDFDYYEFE